MTLAPAFRELHALAVAARPDWAPDEARDAMTAAHLAGWEWRAILREVARLILADDETPATLRNSARRHRGGGPGTGEGREALARANAALKARQAPASASGRDGDR